MRPDSYNFPSAMPSDALASQRGVNRLVIAALVAAVTSLGACGTGRELPAGQAAIDSLRGQSWDQVVARARGSEVVWRMWRGDQSHMRRGS